MSSAVEKTSDEKYIHRTYLVTSLGDSVLIQHSLVSFNVKELTMSVFLQNKKNDKLEIH
jgi:hypothetical protein